MVRQMPAPRAHYQHGGVALQRVGLAGGGVGEVDRSRPAVLQIGLPLDQVGERRRGRVLEIGHEDLRARVQRVDHHLAVARARDLDSTVEKISGNRGDRPVAVTNILRFGQKIGQKPRVELLLPLRSPRQHLQPRPVEASVKGGEEGHRLPAQDLRLSAAGLCTDNNVCGGRLRGHEGPPDRRRRFPAAFVDRFVAFGEVRSLIARQRARALRPPDRLGRERAAPARRADAREGPMGRRRAGARTHRRDLAA